MDNDSDIAIIDWISRNELRGLTGVFHKEEKLYCIAEADSNFGCSQQDPDGKQQAQGHLRHCRAPSQWVMVVATLLL